jgi:hypothetical protein
MIIAVAKLSAAMASNAAAPSAGQTRSRRLDGSKRAQARANSMESRAESAGIGEGSTHSLSRAIDDTVLAMRRTTVIVRRNKAPSGLHSRYVPKSD